MFVAIEKYRTAAQILLGLIAVSFVGFGANQFRLMGSDKQYIVKIGDQVITRQQLDQIAKQSPNASRESVLRSLMNRAYLLEGAKQLGLSISDVQIKQRIVDNPIFHDADGKFSTEQFKNILNSNHISEQDFMNMERQDMLVEALNKILNSNVITDTQVAQFVQMNMAARRLRNVGLNPQAFEQKVAVNDAALKKFYDANQTTYTLPQAVQFEWIRLSPKTLAAKETVSETELRHAVAEAQKSTTHKRKIAHILIEFGNDKAKAKAEAEKIAKEAQAQPQRFAELAKKYSQDADSQSEGGVIGEFSEQGDLVDAAFKKAAFGLTSGEVSQVVESQYGFHIIQATDVTQQSAVDTDAVRQAVQEKKAQPAYAKLREQLSQEAFDSGSLKKGAEKLGLTIQSHTEWLTRDNAPAAHIPQEVVDALFSDDVFAKKHISEGISVNGETWFVQATQTRPKTVESFDKVKEQVRADYIRSESARLAKEEAKRLLADLQAGKSSTLAWSAVQNVTPEQLHGNLSADAYRALMTTVPKNGKPAYVLIDNLGVPELFEIQAIQSSDTVSNEASQISKQMILPVTQHNMMAEAFLDSLSKTVHTEQGIEPLIDPE